MEIYRITEDLIMALKASVKPEREAFETAFQTYRNDLNQRQQAILTQRLELEDQVKRLSSEADALAREVTEHTSRGDVEGAALADSRLEETETRLRAAQRKHKILCEVKITGDPALFTEVQEAFQALTAACERQSKTVADLRHACEQERDRLERLLSGPLRFGEASTFSEERRFSRLQEEFIKVGQPIGTGTDSGNERNEKRNPEAVHRVIVPGARFPY